MFLAVHTIVRAQDVLPELSKQFAGRPVKELPGAIERVYAKSLNQYKGKEFRLDLWRFFWHDSIRNTEMADSLATAFDAGKLKGDFGVEHRIFFRLGQLQLDVNQFEKAIGFFHRGIKVCEKHSNPKMVAAFKREIGKAYLKLSQHETAIQYLKSAYDLYRAQDDSMGVANAAISLGNGYKETGDLEQGRKYYTISLEIAKKYNDQRLIAGNYNNLGNTERREKNYVKALEYFKLALDMNQQSGNKLWESFNYHNIGNTYRDLERYDQSIEYFKKSNALKVELQDSLSLITGYFGLSEVYALVHDYENAYECLLKYNQLKDTLGLTEQASMLKDLEAKYKSENQQLEIERLKAVEALQNEINYNLEMESNKNYKLMLLAILAGLILLGGVTVLWRSNRIKLQTNTLLNSKNAEIEVSNHALKDAMDELSAKNKEIIDSINYATYIQRASLPNISKHSSDALRFELFYAPKDIVSGDFYFSYELFNRSIFGVADCTGHGVPGAMVSLVGMNSLDKIIREQKDSSARAMVSKLNVEVIESLQRGSEHINDGMDISFCIVDHENKRLNFAGANHNAYIVRELGAYSHDTLEEDEVILKAKSDEYALIEVKGARRPIGNTYSENPFTEVYFPLISGDRIVLFSDGYPDQIGGEQDKKMKKTVFHDVLLESSREQKGEQIQILKNHFETWKGAHEQIDDVCLLVVEIL